MVDCPMGTSSIPICLTYTVEHIQKGLTLLRFGILVLRETSAGFQMTIIAYFRLAHDKPQPRLLAILHEKCDNTQ